MYFVLIYGHVLLLLIVTKQRDPETGQQSLLFQVSMLVGNPYMKQVDLKGVFLLLFWEES